MYETLSETEGCDLLSRLFTKRGYAIKRNVLFHEYGVEFHIDGWDPVARVGFEFLTSEDDDHDDLSLEEYKTLTAAQRRGELAMFIIDEVEPVSAEALAAEAHEFLDEVADAAHARLVAASRRVKAAGRRGKAAAPARRPGKKSPASAQSSAASARATKKPTVGKAVRTKAVKKAAEKKPMKKVKAARPPTKKVKRARGR